MATWWAQPKPVGGMTWQQTTIQNLISSSYPYDAADRSNEHCIHPSMRLARQPIIQPLEHIHGRVVGVARALRPGCLILCGPHSRLVDANEIDRQWLSSSGSLQDEVDRPAVNAKERRLFDMMPRVSVRWGVIERPL